MTAPAAPAKRAGDGGRAGRDGYVTLGLIFLTAALIGSNYVALKEALRFASPLVLTGIRVTVGGSLLLAFALARREHLPRTARQLGSIFAVSLCISTTSSMLLAVAVRRVSAGQASLISATMPLWAAILAAALLKERPDARALGGLAVGAFGAAVLAWPALAGRSSVVGVVVLLIGTATWALGVVVLKRWGPPGVSPVMLTAVQLLMSAVCVWAIAARFEGFGRTRLGWDLAVPAFWASAPALAVPFALIATVVRRAPAVQAAASAYLIPVFGLLAAYLVRHEAFEAAELAGGALVIAGVVLVSSPR